MGTGSGILSIIAKENGGFVGNMNLIDNSESSIECAKMNLSLYGVFENSINAQNVDLVDIWFPISGTADALKRPKQANFYSKILEDLGIK